MIITDRGPARPTYNADTGEDTAQILFDASRLKNRLDTFAAVADVIEERCLQDEKWGQQDHDSPEWLLILGEEAGESSEALLAAWNLAVQSRISHLTRATLKIRFDANHGEERRKALFHYRAELVQVAAVAIAAIEALDRNQKRISFADAE